MDASVIHEEITEQLVCKLEESRFVHVALMNRIERRIRTRDELERYATVLIHKLEDMDYKSENMIDRVDRVLNMLERSTAGRS